MRDDLENYRTAFGWLIERGRVVEATEIAFNLFFFWVIRGHAWQGLDWYRPASARGRPAEDVRRGDGAARRRRDVLHTGRDRTCPCRTCTRPRDIYRYPSTSTSNRRQRGRSCLPVMWNTPPATSARASALHPQSRGLYHRRHFGFAWGIGNALEGLALRVSVRHRRALDAAEQALDEARLALRECGPC